MKVLPVDKFTLASRFSPAELHLKLRAVTASEETFRREHSNAAYFGHTTGLGFNIRTTAGRRLGFVPQIIGRYEKTPSGTKIHVTQRLNYYALLVCCLSIPALIYIVFGPQPSLVDADMIKSALASPFGPSDLTPDEKTAVQIGLIRMIGPWVFAPLPLAIILVFWREARKTKSTLSEILAAHVA